MGHIYILTNDSFPDYIKIGYSDNILEEIVRINRLEITPFKFKLYATYKAARNFSNIELYRLISKLNPSFVKSDKSCLDVETRGFYNISKESALLFLKSIAEIHDDLDNFMVHVRDKEESNIDENINRKQILDVDKNSISIDDYLSSKDLLMTKLYKKLESEILNNLEDVCVKVNPQYIAWETNNKYFAEIRVKKSSIRIQTFIPNKKSKMGEVLSGHLGTLNYRMYINSFSDIKKVKNIILESYNKKAKNPVDINISSKEIKKSYKVPEAEIVENVIPDGEYIMTATLKESGSKVFGKMQIKNGHCILKAGSIIAPEVERYEKCRGLFVGLKLENNKLLEDMEFNSVSSAATVVRGKSTNGWISWVDSNGNLIDIYRKKDT